MTITVPAENPQIAANSKAARIVAPGNGDQKAEAAENRQKANRKNKGMRHGICRPESNEPLLMAAAIAVALINSDR